MSRATLLTLAAVGLIELALLGYTRVVSGLAHLRAVQDVAANLSADTAAAGCAEGVSAVDDFWPAVPLLNLGRIVPLATAHAWGQVPRIVDVARQTCSAVEVYAQVAPSMARSLDDGVGTDLLTDVRREQTSLLAANAQLDSAWRQAAAIDTQALAADPRLARVARLLDAARQQQPGISEALGAVAPAPIESLLGGNGPRAIQLSIVDSDPPAQAYLELDQGKLITVGLGQDDAPAAAVISVDRAGLENLEAALPGAVVPESAGQDIVAEALLTAVWRMPLGNISPVASALKHSADEQHAWFWFEDPTLQSLAGGFGWAGP